MSLINDALKKARQAQVNAPARETSLQLRPPESDHPVRPGPSLGLPAIVVAVGVVGAALFWMVMKNGPANQSGAAGQSLNSMAPASPRPTAGGATAIAVPARPIPAPAAEPTPPTPEPQTVLSESPTAAIPVGVPAPRLNGIFYHPSKPTAIVNNRLVSPGSHVGEFWVLAITQHSVLLVGNGQTNVLSLSE